MNAPPKLHHVDDHLIVAEKPSGLLAVPGRTEPDCLAARVQALYPDARVVHRLDMDTSGLMLFARGLHMQRVLSRAFEKREVGKRYVAVVEGRVAEEAGRIEAPLIVDWPNRPRQIIDRERGKPSLTLWRRLAFGDARSRLALEPVTGRSHQLRVHLASIGHPILGDDLYAPAEVLAAAPRLMLHAARLEFAHPADGRGVVFESAVPF